MKCLCLSLSLSLGRGDSHLDVDESGWSVVDEVYYDALRPKEKTQDLLA